MSQNDSYRSGSEFLDARHARKDELLQAGRLTNPDPLAGHPAPGNPGQPDYLREMAARTASLDPHKGRYPPRPSGPDTGELGAYLDAAEAAPPRPFGTGGMIDR